MPWFIYHYPFPINQPFSYTIVPDNGIPECHHGDFLGAIEADVVPNTTPAQPDLDVPGLEEAIRTAMKNRCPTSTIKLRNSP